MKGVVFLGDRKLELREFPDPTPGPRDVILEIKASGMCGSDLHTYRAPANPGGVITGGIKRTAGVIAGHEPCGVVAAVGTAVTDGEPASANARWTTITRAAATASTAARAGRRCASRDRWSTAPAVTAATRST